VSVVTAPCSENRTILHVADTLRTPLTAELRHRIRSLLCRGERRIVLDLTHVSRIDAAGVGELVRAYNLTSAVDGALRIAHPAARVRDVLYRAGLLDLLMTDSKEEAHEDSSWTPPLK
jgi:anti-anti-sigma factor